MEARTLADLEKLWLAAPMQYEPGEKWKYTQSGINAAARIVEVISGMTFDAFVQRRIFDPLGMKDTTFYPTDAQLARLATAYVKNAATGALDAVPPRRDFGPRNRPPQGHGGLYSTAPDYARFCQMLLNGGTLDGRRYLSAEAMKALTTPLTGDLPTGFFQTAAWGNRGANYGWGIAHQHPAHPARRRGVDALAGHVRPRRRLGHAGVDRPREGRGVHPHDPAFRAPEQRRQRGPPGLPAGRGRGPREVATRQARLSRPARRSRRAPVRQVAGDEIDEQRTRDRLARRSRESVVA